MNANGRHGIQDDAPVLKYVAWFVATFVVVAIVVGIVQAVLPSSRALRTVGGILIVFCSAEFARFRFTADHGRGLRREERWRLFLGTELLLFSVMLLGAAYGIQRYNHQLFAFRQIPPAYSLLIALAASAVYAPVLWFCYWLRNPASDPDPRKAAAARPKARVMVLGSGGREHALAWKLAQSPRVSQVLVVPGNAGTAREPKCRNVECDLGDMDALVQLARSEGVSVTVVGPEGPLVAGVVDRFRAAGLRIFGPTAAAAQLEGSKAFAKAFLARHRIPTADYAVHTELEAALAHVRERARASSNPIVVKADGLAAGKGVVVATTLAEAEAAVRDMLAGDAFGAAGARVVIEEFLDGEEASFISMVDGAYALPMATSQDHKRVGDGDTGPNTGGMGAYSPAPVVTPEVQARIMREVVMPTVRGMAEAGRPFTGFLYAGLMIDGTGAPRVIEFNVRFGDPETQPIMMRLQSDLLDLVEAAIDGELRDVDARWNPRPSLGVVMAAAHYPAAPATGDVIEGLPRSQPLDSKVFHAGTRLDADGNVVTSGGRVLCVCALGDSVADAQRRAYEEVSGISWPGEFHRRDVGWRAIARERG
jgi:phosphoribosylamine--glycine ligase